MPPRAKYSDVFGKGYHHSIGIIGTDYLAFGVGMIIAAFGTIKAMDHVFRKQTPDGKQKSHKPESRCV